jgi:hypothetical protein
MSTETIDTPGIITVDYGQSLQAMIAAGKYDWVKLSITADKFPVEGTGIKKFRNKLFRFGRYISSEAAVAAMQKEKFTPATHVHGLAFGATFPDTQRKFPIACLGSFVRVFGFRSVVCLHGVGDQRHLHLYDWDGVWYDVWRFLAVQEVSET